MGLYMANADKVQLVHVVMPLVLCLASIAGLLLLLRRVLDAHRAALAASVLIVAFFGYGYAVEPVQGFGWLPHGTRLAPQLWLALPVAAGVAWILVRLVRSSASLLDLSRVVAVVLAALTVLNAGTVAFGARGLEPSDALRLEAELTPAASPDIYYIIPDGYASERVLHEVYGYNNGPWLDGLEARGFAVPANASSNYPMSALSLASSLNMVYLDPLAVEMGRSENWMAALERTENSNVLRLLAGAGYHTIHVGSGWGATASNPHFAQEVDCGGPTSFTMELIHYSALRLVENALVGAALRDRIDCQFDAVAEVAGDQRPTFTFAHVIAPHPPFVFAADGSANRNGELELAGDPWMDHAGYVAQLQYINSRIDATVDAILSTSPDAVILIQGDHGTASRFAARDGRTLPVLPDEPGPELRAAIQERFGILAAFHVPGLQVPDTVSPVNSFRLVFNHLFGSDFEVLEHHNWYAGYARPYSFTDVTGIVGAPTES